MGTVGLLNNVLQYIENGKNEIFTISAKNVLRPNHTLFHIPPEL